MAAEGHRVGVLDADVWGFSVPRMMGVSGKPVGLQQHDPAARGARGEGHLDGVLRPGGDAGDLARADAAQGRPAVPRRRVLGRAGLPAVRPAAGDGRRLDLDGVVPAGRVDAGRDHAAGGRAQGGRARREDGRRRSVSASSASSRTCRASCARTAASASTCSARAAGRRRRTRWACRCSARCRCARRSAQGGDEGRPIVVADPDSAAGQALREAARALATSLKTVVGKPLNLMGRRARRRRRERPRQRPERPRGSRPRRPRRCTSHSGHQH